MLNKDPSNLIADNDVDNLAGDRFRKAPNVGAMINEADWYRQV